MPNERDNRSSERMAHAEAWSLSAGVIHQRHMGIWVNIRSAVPPAPMAGGIETKIFSPQLALGKFSDGLEVAV